MGCKNGKAITYNVTLSWEVNRAANRLVENG